MRTMSVGGRARDGERRASQGDMRACRLRRRNYHSLIQLHHLDVRRAHQRSGAQADSASHSRSKPGELFVLDPGQQDLGGHRADERHEHVPLRIPDVTLRAEERVG